MSLAKKKSSILVWTELFWGKTVLTTAQAQDVESIAHYVPDTSVRNNTNFEHKTKRKIRKCFVT